MKLHENKDDDTEASETSRSHLNPVFREAMIHVPREHTYKIVTSLGILPDVP